MGFWGFGVGVLGFRVCLGFRLNGHTDVECDVPAGALGFRVSGLGFRVSGFGFTSYLGLWGFGVLGLGFWGLGFV